MKTYRVCIKGNSREAEKALVDRALFNASTFVSSSGQMSQTFWDIEHDMYVCDALSEWFCETTNREGPFAPGTLLFYKEKEETQNDETTSHEYRVTWEVDIRESSPQRAAREAWEIHKDPNSCACVFKVSGGNLSEPLEIDLSKTNWSDL